MDRKRKLNNYDNSLSKSVKKKCIDWTSMVSASSIRNYMLDDPLIDWLKYYNITNINNININHINHINNNININSDYHTTFILEQGNIFEKMVYEKLLIKAKNENYTIIKISDCNESQSINKFNETIEMIEKGIDIIYQGVLHDYKNNIYGTPDLLIRSDKFNKLFNQNINFNRKDYYYVVVDIKHSTLHFNSNKTFLKDTNCIPAYKGQLLIYNRLLSAVQKYQPQYSFVLGKKYEYTKNGITIIGDNYMENIATIDYKNNDVKYNDKVDKAIEWIIRMRNEGHTWKLLPKPSVKELYPNMKNDRDIYYKKIKSELANKIGEITNIWWCGYNKREIAHSKNIYTWKNKKLTAKIMDFKENSISKTVDYILDVNRNNNNNNIIIRTDDLILSNNWRNDNTYLEFYLDFETLNIQNGNCDENINGIIFMIGLGWEENNIFKYKSFVAKSYNDVDELNIMNEMWDFINNKKIEFNKNEIKFIHWSNAEVNFYNQFLNKNHNYNYNLNNCLDLYKVFLNNNVIVKGALNFSLKTIASAMYNNKMITTKWDNACNNGLDAMMQAYNLYKNNIDVSNNNTMNNIIKYNMIDCKVMWDILLYLRNNY